MHLPRIDDSLTQEVRYNNTLSRMCSWRCLLVLIMKRLLNSIERVSTAKVLRYRSLRRHLRAHRQAQQLPLAVEIITVSCGTAVSEDLFITSTNFVRWCSQRDLEQYLVQRNNRSSAFSNLLWCTSSPSFEIDLTSARKGT